MITKLQTILHWTSLKCKRKANEQWYNWYTPLRLVQGYGRSIRSKEDWAKTYALDTAFGYFVRKIGICYLAGSSRLSDLNLSIQKTFITYDI